MTVSDAAKYADVHPKRSMSGVLGARGGAPETYMWTWRSRWPFTLAATSNGGRRPRPRSRFERRNVDVDVRVHVAASNAASGANDERAPGRAQRAPRRGDHPEGAASDAAGLWPPKILKIL